MDGDMEGETETLGETEGLILTLGDTLIDGDCDGLKLAEGEILGLML